MLYQILAFARHGEHKNIKFKLPAPTWNEKFELPDESYSILDIEDYFVHIFK